MARSADAAAGAAQAAQNRAIAEYIRNANQGIRAGAPGAGSRSPDTIEQAARASVGLPTIGSPNYPMPAPALVAPTPTSNNRSSTAPAAPAPAPAPAPIPSISIPEIRPPGGGSTGTASNVDQTSAMYAKALEELMRQYGVSQENILASIGRLKSDPYNTANAYAGMQLAGAQVAADPLAEYMQAAGLSGGQSAAAQQMAQAEADAYLRAMQNVQNVMSTSQQQANLSRMADIGLIETGATQDLESNLNMLRLGLERDRLGALTGLQQRNLENDLQMRNAIANQISNVFAGQNVAPESILKLIEAALAKMNTNRWTGLPAFGV